MSTAQLRLVREARVRDLLPAGSPHRLEASGVVAADRRFYVIFDNLRAVAVIDEDLDRLDGNALVPTGPHDEAAYEDIARDPVTGNLYLLIEAAPRDDGYLARVEEYDPQLRFQSAGWLEFPLREANKGIEGLDCVRRGGVLYLLGLCERQPGGGRVVVFRRGRRNWKQHTTIELPDTVRFTDYSAISVAGDRLAVVSQESSALWLGRLLPSTWQVSGPGRTYLFPRDADGGIAYCTVEGVCWRAADEFVVVSDRAKPGKRDRPCRAEDESLHLFALPAAPG